MKHYACPGERPRRPKGWVRLDTLLKHLAELGTVEAMGLMRGVRDVAERCCEKRGLVLGHTPLYRQKVSDDEIRARIAEAILERTR